MNGYGASARCPVCAGPALLTARYPHSWRNRSGATVTGFREALLCALCDAADPAALALVSLLTADTGSAPFSDLVREWLDGASGQAPDAAALAEEEARWRAGEL